jgi:hypothetical protein
MRLILRVAVAAVLALGLTACGAQTDDSAAPAVSSSSSGTADPSSSAAEAVPAPSSTAGAPSLPPPSPKKPDDGQPSKASGDLTLTGDLQEGVEGGCVLLKASDKLYLLLGGDRTKMQGSRATHVVVTGKVAAGMMTTCQQGTPFQVTEMRPA